MKDKIDMMLMYIVIKPIANRDFWLTSHEYAKSSLVNPLNVEQELYNVTYLIFGTILVYRINDKQYAL
jgi:hypothetical protein